jgi:hypothetical protein
MAPSPTTSVDRRATERELLDRLLGMYTEQQALYGEILELSRRQREQVRQGAPLVSIRALLQRKQQLLDTVRRLELAERSSKDRWQRGRSGWTAAGRTSLHRKLEDVGQIIEDILACEEENDLELLQQCR